MQFQLDLLDLKPLQRRRCPRTPAALVEDSISTFKLGNFNLIYD